MRNFDNLLSELRGGQASNRHQWLLCCLAFWRWTFGNLVFTVGLGVGWSEHIVFAIEVSGFVFVFSINASGIAAFRHLVIHLAGWRRNLGHDKEKLDQLAEKRYVNGLPVR